MDTCTWYRDSTSINWSTDCGITHFAYAQPDWQPSIIADGHGKYICPYCHKVIEYDDHYDNEDDEEYEEED